MSVNFLAGYTGFIGSNLTLQHEFSGLFNSKNISQAYGKCPDILVYSGVRSEMFTANKYPQKDKENIYQAIENISRINASKTILISTSAVYDENNNSNNNSHEDSLINTQKLTHYGANRYYLERWADENIKDLLIVRLPAVFGVNLKKNFIYDFINEIPAMLNESKFHEFSSKYSILKEFYSVDENGFYRCKILSGSEKILLKKIFHDLNFSALNFTDSRSIYQFYPVKYLWQHINTALSHQIRIINLAVPPVSVSELYKFLTGREFVNELDKKPFYNNMKTKYYEIFGGSCGYIMSLEQELREIKSFVRSYES